VTGSNDKRAKIWNAITGEVVHTLVGHKTQVTSVLISINRMVMTASKDKSVRHGMPVTGTNCKCYPCMKGDNRDSDFILVR
jgi:WD40 repeat protein